MALTNILKKVKPFLLLKQIQDIYIRQNFESLTDYFSTQNQLLDFKFFEVVFTSAESNRKIAHGLEIIPKDVLVSQIVGQGRVTFNLGLFTDEDLSLTADGPCVVRFFVGTYWDYKNNVNAEPTDSMSFGGIGASGIPSGSIIPFGGTSAPTGYLLCDGSPYNRTSYPALFAVIGTAYGAPTPTTFNVPDLRGRFIRGVDGATNRDPDRASRTAVTGGNSGDNVGSLQEDAFQGHWHSTNVGLQIVAKSSDVGGTNHVLPNGNEIYITGPTTDGENGTPRTTSETRPKNVSVNFIIKT